MSTSERISEETYSELIFRIRVLKPGGICSPGKNRRREMLGTVQCFSCGETSVQEGGKEEPKLKRV